MNFLSIFFLRLNEVGDFKMVSDKVNSEKSVISAFVQ
jgi:hypothetical protein